MNLADIKTNSRLRDLHLRIKTLARFEVFTAMTLKNAVFWDIKT
jgi:hypothetical protein